MADRHPSRIAREQAGLTLEAAARLLWIQPETLRRLETPRGLWSAYRASRAVALYQERGARCSMIDFLPTEPPRVRRKAET